MSDERTEQPMSEAELAGIEDAHRKHRDTPSSYCMDCGHDWPCPTVRAVRAARSEREARGRVEAAARRFLDHDIDPHAPDSAWDEWARRRTALDTELARNKSKESG